MSWRIRHEGSPQSVDGLTLTEVVEGLQDARWSITDEVMGPDDQTWQSIDNHPALEEMAAEMQPPPRHEEDESRLDFNPLIDVCLVLLIFFILTMSYGALEKLLEAAQATSLEKTGIVDITVVKETMVRVEIVEQAGGKPTLNLQAGDVTKMNVTVDQLIPTLKELPLKGKTAMLIQYTRNVPHGIVVAVQDAAKAVGIEQVFFPIPKK
jgi:biopolymer transport protein ExbD